jgi:hypothetical protein
MVTKVRTLIAGVPYHVRYMIGFLMLCLIVGIGIDIIHTTFSSPSISTRTNSSTHSVGEISPLHYQGSTTITPIADSYTGGTISAISTSPVNKITAIPVTVSETTIPNSTSTKSVVKTVISPQTSDFTTTVGPVSVIQVDDSDVSLPSPASSIELTSTNLSSSETPVSMTLTTPLVSALTSCLSVLDATACVN